MKRDYWPATWRIKIVDEKEEFHEAIRIRVGLDT
jgi:hypothetical protein